MFIIVHRYCLSSNTAFIYYTANAFVCHSHTSLCKCKRNDKVNILNKRSRRTYYRQILILTRADHFSLNTCKLTRRRNCGKENHFTTVCALF